MTYLTDALRSAAAHLVDPDAALMTAAAHTIDHDAADLDRLVRGLAIATGRSVEQVRAAEGLWGAVEGRGALGDLTGLSSRERGAGGAESTVPAVVGVHCLATERTSSEDE